MCTKCNEEFKDESPSNELSKSEKGSLFKIIEEIDEELKKEVREVVTRDKLFDKILSFEKLTNLDCIITGSIAFAEQGFLNWRDVKNIDLIVGKIAMTAGQLEMLKAFEITSPPPTVKPGYPPLPGTIRFTFQGIEINVFMVSFPVEFLIDPATKLKISKLGRIIKEKQAMGRKKDYQQLNNYAKQFLI